MADRNKLDQLSKKRARDRKDIDKIKNDYRKWESTDSYKDLVKYLETESESLMHTVKNRFTVMEGKVVPLDDGAVNSLLYKSAGLDMAAQYIKSKLS